jgi:uncharacterized membrane protein
VTTTQWLLGFHLVGAFLFVSGGIAVGVLHTLALRRERPSEIALLLRLTRSAVALVGAGSLLTIALGAALVDHGGFSFGDAWIAASLALWFASIVLGAVGGRSARRSRYLAERLAAANNGSAGDLHRALRNPVARVSNYGSFFCLLAILGLMVWKP